MRVNFWQVLSSLTYTATPGLGKWEGNATGLQSGDEILQEQQHRSASQDEKSVQCSPGAQGAFTVTPLITKSGTEGPPRTPQGCGTWFLTVVSGELEEHMK